jgi:DNA primase
MADRLMTYDELAEALGRSGEAVRALVIRKRWRRTLGNDGRARITVPVEALEARRPPSAARARSPSEARPEPPPEPPPSGAPSEAPVVTLLHSRIAELVAELRETRATLAEAQAKAARNDSLEALVATERERLSDTKAERDRWAAQAEQVVAAVDPLKTTIEALKAALDAERGRLSELREERDRWRTAATARRSWWPWRRSA